MDKLFWPIVLIALFAIAAAVLKQLTGKRISREPVKARALMTQRELEAFRTLRAALEPSHTVLAQVAFSALLTAKSRPTRSTFDRKVADFVVLNGDGAVLALIEIDDSSHNGREAQDRARDAMLNTAGYRVIRYRKLPTADVVRADVMKPMGT